MIIYVAGAELANYEGSIECCSENLQTGKFHFVNISLA